MFTVLIESDEGRQQIFKEFPSILIFRRGNANFDEVIKREMIRIHNEKQPSGCGSVGSVEFSQEIKDIVRQYTAYIRSDCGEHEWFVNDSDSVYITNQHGKTVATIK